MDTNNIYVLLIVIVLLLLTRRRRRKTGTIVQVLKLSLCKYVYATSLTI